MSDSQKKFYQELRERGSRVNKRTTGSRYEDRAAAFLKSRGLRLLEKNFYCRKGEIDLILMDGACLVFAEVKYRSGPGFGSPLEAVDSRKQKRIRDTAAYYMFIRRISMDTPCRFDAVGIMGEEIQWIRNAF